MSRILVVGGAGFIGNVVVRKLIQDGHDVTIYDSQTTYDNYEPVLHQKKIDIRLQDFDVNMFKGDINYESHICEAFSLKPEIVINLANVPITKIAVDNPLMAADSMITGLLRLLELSKQNNVKRFVNISSSMVYGDFESSSMSEDCQILNPLEIYGNLKLAGERLVRSYTRLHGLDHTIVRPSACYGPTGNEAFVITKFLRAARAGEPIDILGCETALDFTYVDDIAQGIVKAATMTNGRNQTFNITRGRKRYLTEVAQILGYYYDVNVKIDAADRLYPKRGQLNIDKAKDLLGYEPQFDLEEGLKLFDEHITKYDL